VTSVQELKVGVLGVQGSVWEHAQAVDSTLKEMGLKGCAVVVKTPSQLEAVHGLIIPGGESTTIGRLSHRSELLKKITQAAEGGMPILGTCAGLIVLAKEVLDLKVGVPEQPLLGLMDMRVVRNAFGRQRESFEADVSIPILGEKPYRAVFIRAPVIEQVWGGNEVIARYEDKVVGVQQGDLVATSFHPELTQDSRLHQYFMRTVLQRV